MSGVNGKQLHDAQRDLKRAYEQARLLESSTKPMEARIEAMEARFKTFRARLLWLVFGR